MLITIIYGLLCQNVGRILIALPPMTLNYRFYLKVRHPNLYLDPPSHLPILFSLIVFCFPTRIILMLCSRLLASASASCCPVQLVESNGCKRSLKNQEWNNDEWRNRICLEYSKTNYSVFWPLKGRNLKTNTIRLCGRNEVKRNHLLSTRLFLKFNLIWGRVLFCFYFYIYSNVQITMRKQWCEHVYFFLFCR